MIDDFIFFDKRVGIAIRKTNTTTTMTKPTTTTATDFRVRVIQSIILYYRCYYRSPGHCQSVFYLYRLSLFPAAAATKQNVLIKPFTPYSTTLYRIAHSVLLRRKHNIPESLLFHYIYVGIIIARYFIYCVASRIARKSSKSHLLPLWNMNSFFRNKTKNTIFFSSVTNTSYRLNQIVRPLCFMQLLHV